MSHMHVILSYLGWSLCGLGLTWLLVAGRKGQA